jgi:glycosyltransferase involved in cell wall biosynthesis
MKIGVFVGNYNPEIGGGYTFQREIYRAIEMYGPASGHEFVVFTYAKGMQQEALSGGTLKVVSIPCADYGNPVSKLCRSVVRFIARTIYRSLSIDFFDQIADPISAHIRRESVDVVWSLTPSCFLSEIPFMTTVWDLQHRLQPYFPEVCIRREWENREKEYSILLRKATYIFTGTATGKNEIEKFYQIPGERIRVLPLPTPQFISADDHVTDGIVLRKYKIPETYLFYPAQFWPHKNHYGLLMGLKALREKFGVNLPVVFVGTDMGNLTYVNEVVSDLGLTVQVHFLGFVPRGHLEALYRNAFVLIFPTFFGPDNLPPLEAFALGCPVIASKVSGAEEQLGDAAILVDPTDPIGIAAAINLLLHDASMRQTLVDRGLERASRWTGASYFKSVCSIFDEFENIRRTWSNSEPFKLVR